MTTAYIKIHTNNDVTFNAVHEYMKGNGLLARVPKRSLYEFNHSKITSDIPRSKFQTDFVRLFIQDVYIYIFKIIDIFNREIAAYHISTFSGSMSSEAILVKLYDVCATFPITLIQDNGSCYIANTYKELARNLHIVLEYTKAYTPEHNGVIERSWKTDKYEGLASHFLSLDNIYEVYAEWIYFYNNLRPHSTNNYQTPAMRLSKYLLEHLEFEINPNPNNIRKSYTYFPSLTAKAEEMFG